jgi:hypothetical protein
MKITFAILLRCFVKPFFRQHAGFFIFLFIIMFGAVGRVDGAGLFDYHFSLIRGMLKNPFAFLLILLLWLLYEKKCEQFIQITLRKPEFSFLHMSAQIESKSLFGMLVMVQTLIFLPVIAYAIIMFVVGVYLKTYTACTVLLFYLVALCLLSARWYLYQFQNPGLFNEIKKRKINLMSAETHYWTLLIRYIGENKKLLFVGIKIFSCGILYGMLMNQMGTDYDLNMIVLFFSLGILGHGLLIHQIRDLEETRLRFYRSVPISLFNRFTQYAYFYLILLLPEILTIALLTPNHLHYSDALVFIFFSYSVLLFLHSLLLIQFIPMKTYLKIILCLYLIIYCSILISSFLWFCIFTFLSAGLIFRGRYYKYERQMSL